jgi:hypothetical protein
MAIRMCRIKLKSAHKNTYHRVVMLKYDVYMGLYNRYIYDIL